MTSAADKGEVTRLLAQWAEGDGEALGRLIPLVVEELRAIARGYLAREDRDLSLQPTELIHDVYVRLVGQRAVSWDNRKQFFAFSAQLMRRLLVDHARRRRAAKRSAVKVAFEEALAVPELGDAGVLALNDVLGDLEKLDRRQSRIVEMRIFGGWTIEEIAESLEVGLSTVKRDWKAALCWLRRELERR